MPEAWKECSNCGTWHAEKVCPKCDEFSYSQMLTDGEYKLYLLELKIKKMDENIEELKKSNESLKKQIDRLGRDQWGGVGVFWYDTGCRCNGQFYRWWPITRPTNYKIVQAAFVCT